MYCRRFRFMVLNATFSNISVISWQSVLLMEETGVPDENHRLVVSHWQILSYSVVLSSAHLSRFKLTTLVVIGTDYIGSYKSNYHIFIVMHFKRVLFHYLREFSKFMKIPSFEIFFHGNTIAQLKTSEFIWPSY